MFNIISDALRTATRTNWDAPQHWLTEDQHRRQEREAREYRRRAQSHTNTF